MEIYLYVTAEVGEKQSKISPNLWFLLPVFINLMCDKWFGFLNQKTPL